VIRYYAVAAAAAAGVALAFPAVPAAQAQPVADQFFASENGISWADPGNGLIYSTDDHNGSYTEWNLWNGDRLQQAGTDKCATYNAANNDWDVITCSTSVTAQQVSFISEANGTQEIESHYDDKCMDLNALNGTIKIYTCNNSQYEEVIWGVN
jgi:hypothetical protein